MPDTDTRRLTKLEALIKKLTTEKMANSNLDIPSLSNGNRDYAWGYLDGLLKAEKLMKGQDLG